MGGVRRMDGWRAQFGNGLTFSGTAYVQILSFFQKFSLKLKTNFLKPQPKTNTPIIIKTQNQLKVWMQMTHFQFEKKKKKKHLQDFGQFFYITALSSKPVMGTKPNHKSRITNQDFKLCDLNHG